MVTTWVKREMGTLLHDWASNRFTGAAATTVPDDLRLGEVGVVMLEVSGVVLENRGK